MGLVAAISGFLTERGCFVKESAQYGDPITNQFFMRVVFEARERQVTLAQLIQDFTPVGERFAMEWHIYDSAIKTRVLLMVSRFGHCLNDLLYRWRSGFLPTLTYLRGRGLDAVATSESWRIESWCEVSFDFLFVARTQGPRFWTVRAATDAKQFEFRTIES